jgi:hypothetical protein
MTQQQHQKHTKRLCVLSGATKDPQGCSAQPMPLCKLPLISLYKNFIQRQFRVNARYFVCVKDAHGARPERYFLINCADQNATMCLRRNWPHIYITYDDGITFNYCLWPAHLSCIESNQHFWQFIIRDGRN